MKPVKQQIDDFLSYRIDTVIDKKSLTTKLLSGKKLIVKHGVDPTTTDLHLGHAVNYHKMRVLQDMGHTVVFLVGGFTARFGDPTDKKETKILRDKTEVEKSAKNYIKQALKILDPKRTEIRYNSEWYDKMNAEELLKLMSHFTHAQVMERDMFVERTKQKREIGLHEPVYPVLQGYDSVMLKSHLTIIGTDQLFNEMRGRDLQRDFGQAPQNIITVPLLVGLDGKQKMSQSLNNAILITEPADSQFGKIMSLPDSAIPTYLELATTLPKSEVDDLIRELKKKSTNPRDVKIKLAKTVVTLYHGQAAANRAASHFEQVFTKRKLPNKIPSIRFPKKDISIIDFLEKTQLIDSRSEGRRLLMQRAIKINQELIQDPHYKFTPASGVVVQVGKRKFIKIS